MDEDSTGDAAADAVEVDEDAERAERAARRGRRASYIRFVAWIVFGALVVTAGVYIWWQAKPSIADLRHQALLDTKSELRIGVMSDMPGVSELDPATHTYRGFDIDIAYLVAADLGFRRDQVHFYTVSNEDREKASVLADGKSVQLDMVIAAYSITDERQRTPYVNFSSPYLRTEQSVVTLADHPDVHALPDLTGKRVCTLGTSTSASPASKAGIVVVLEDKISTCMKRLTETHDVDAVTTDAVILAGFLYQDTLANPGHPALKGHNISLEGEELWGISTGGKTEDKEALRKLVNLSLYKSQHDPNDTRWEEAFDRSLRVEQPASGDQRVAIDQQPDAEKEDVRQWPWQNLGSGPTTRTTPRPNARRRRPVS